MVPMWLWSQECQKKLDHKLSLDAYLLKPVQRITKYQLMLKVPLAFSGPSSSFCSYHIYTYCICHNINTIRHQYVFGLHWDTLNFSSVTGYLCNVIHAAGEPWLIITCPLPSPSLIFQAELWSPVLVVETCSQTLGYHSCPPTPKGSPMWSQVYVDFTVLMLD